MPSPSEGPPPWLRVEDYEMTVRERERMMRNMHDQIEAMNEAVGIKCLHGNLYIACVEGVECACKLVEFRRFVENGPTAKQIAEHG